MKSWFSHGKLLLIGEYAVLHGMEALALPTTPGQWLHAWETETKGNSKLIWQSKEVDGSEWFLSTIETEIMHASDSSDTEIGNTLLQLLQEVKRQSPEFFNHRFYRVETQCEFNRNWGLGSSSTLTNLIASWSNTNAFALQDKVFKGSGYDIAIAQLGKALVYWLENGQANWSPWSFPEEISRNWTLVFPGEKVATKEDITVKKSKIQLLKEDAFMWQQLKMCVEAVKSHGSLLMTEAMLETWQALLAAALEIPRTYDALGIQPVKGGLCKWLGAWGGDAVLVNDVVLQTYTATFETMDRMPWNDLVKRR